MQDPFDIDAPAGRRDLDADLMRELEHQTISEIDLARSHQRFDLKLTLVLQPANSSQVRELKASGTTTDISNGGCRAVLPVPLAVGDVYRLQFEGDQLTLPLVFGRCLRCRLIREDAFEAGFKFFSPIDLPGTAPELDEDDLLA